MEFGFPMLTVCGVCMCVCARVVLVKDRVGGRDWLLHSRCTCGGSVCGELEYVRVYVFAEWSGCFEMLFSVGVEV